MPACYIPDRLKTGLVTPAASLFQPPLHEVLTSMDDSLPVKGFLNWQLINGCLFTELSSSALVLLFDCLRHCLFEFDLRVTLSITFLTEFYFWWQGLVGWVRDWSWEKKCPGWVFSFMSHSFSSTYSPVPIPLPPPPPPPPAVYFLCSVIVRFTCITLCHLCQVPHTAVHKPLQRALDPQVLSLHVHTRPFHIVSSYGLFRR